MSMSAWFIKQDSFFTNLRGIVIPSTLLRTGLSGVFGAKHPAHTRGRDASEDLSMTRLLVEFVKHILS
jgi:hypothetical protein